jgi:hypothetical protein
VPRFRSKFSKSPLDPISYKARVDWSRMYSQRYDWAFCNRTGRSLLMPFTSPDGLDRVSRRLEATYRILAIMDVELTAVNSQACSAGIVIEVITDQ